MKTTLGRLTVTALALTAAACVSQPSGGGGTTASAPANQGVQARLAGHSPSGEAISGDAYCSYYAPDGTLATVFQGFAPEYGTWSVQGSRVCEGMGGISSCAMMDFMPSGQVMITSLEGSGGFTTTATVSPGNICGV